MNRYSLKNFFLYTALSAGCMLALLPLFWMIIIACKQEGQALKFDFIPSKFGTTMLYSVTVGAPRPRVILEYRNPSAKSVFVKAEFNGGREVEMPGQGGLFSITFFD